MIMVMVQPASGQDLQHPATLNLWKEIKNILNENDNILLAGNFCNTQHLCSKIKK